MPSGGFLLPDVLVLAGGGTLGEAWMTGVLAGIEDQAAVDFRRVEQFVGTSAGSIVAASLVAGRSPRRPLTSDKDDTPMPDPARPTGSRGVAEKLARAWGRYAWASTAPLAAPLLAVNAPGGAVARALVLARVPNGAESLDSLQAEVQRAGPRFDGRLRICVVDRARGRRVVFGAPGAPRATVAEAVAASCAVPWIFVPVTIGGREYVDGGVWSITNLDVATTARDTRVLCLSVSASLELARSSAFGAARAATRAAELVEAQVLRRRGAEVQTIGPDARSAQAIGTNLMDAKRGAAVLAAGFRQGRSIAAG